MRDRSTTQERTRTAETRCAIYTRKSSEEGLEQEFNSLHAQREACQAYILSQRHEGWRALPTLYDDGGVSGGTMDRPSLTRLLDDIRARRIDLVVIYKVDRLTRSLADFAKLVDVFNAHRVSFVSVTQQFNTATSMGRLTLNMLLSFAQFEREVTGERIRDKIAASKRKGMWMGGHPPLGYDVRDRKLVVNPAEAAQVERIFRTYLELGSVRLLQDRLASEGITTKQRHFATGRTGGGKPILRGNLYEMLRNRLYRGEIAHKEHVYAGEHAAIIDAALWAQVQARLSERDVERSPATDGQPSLLTGIVFSGAGDRLTLTHAKKGSRRYRYYVCRRLVTGVADAAPDGQRLPAGELDRLVIGALHDLIATPALLAEAMKAVAGGAAQHRQWQLTAGELARKWDRLSSQRIRHIVRTVITRVSVHADLVEIVIDPQLLSEVILGSNAAAAVAKPAGSAKPEHLVIVPARLKRAGQEMRLVIAGQGTATQADPVLAKLIDQGLQFKDRLLASHEIGLAELAAQAGISGSHFTRVLRLGFLAPDILAAIADGKQPVGLTATKLSRDTRLPLSWVEQRTLLGFPQPA